MISPAGRAPYPKFSGLLVAPATFFPLVVTLFVYTKSYLGSIKRVNVVWPKVERPMEVRKETFFVSFQKTLYESIRKEKNQENLERHVLDMAARYARFIFIREELVWKSILSFLSL